MLATEKDSITTDTEMNIAMDWASKDGIVGYMWHWAAPDDKSVNIMPTRRILTSKRQLQRKISQNSALRISKSFKRTAR